jgi:hypothetical protein
VLPRGPVALPGASTRASSADTRYDGPMKSTSRPTEISTLPASFQVGAHTLLLWLDQRRWTMSLDGTVGAVTFETQAEAWEAGVREADRLDRSVAGA